MMNYNYQFAKNIVSAEEIALSLRKWKKLGPNRFKACCPCHDDKTPSLSISVSNDGKTLVHCFSGCSQDELIKELINRGLWKESHPSKRTIHKSIETEYFKCQEILDVCLSDIRSGKYKEYKEEDISSILDVINKLEALRRAYYTRKVVNG